ncbi:hypothetical protein AB0J43_54545, partial [Nonomuraea fuscirosea]
FVTFCSWLAAVPLIWRTASAMPFMPWMYGRLLWGLLADHRNGAARILHDTGVDLRELAREAQIPTHRAA